MARKTSQPPVEPTSDKSPSTAPPAGNIPQPQVTYEMSRRKSSTGRVTELTTVEMRPAKSTGNKAKLEADALFLKDSLSIFKSIADDSNEQEIRRKALEEQRFKEGDQWPADIADLRTLKRRPMITINKVKPAVRIVCNDQRQNRAAIKVAPMDGRAHIKTAEILAGAVRHIEVNSMSDIAVDNACEGQVTFGFGYMRLRVDYASPYSMDQEIYIVRVKDPFSVYYGPSNEPDYSDANDCFITEDLIRQEYAQRFPTSAFASATDFTGVGDSMREWGTSSKIRICERFWREFEKKMLCRMTDGSSMLKESIPPALLKDNSIGIQTLPNGQLDERETEIPVVYWSLFNAKEILVPKRKWNGQYIPIIPVLGDDTIVDGKRVMSGIVRSAMDPSRQYNYFRSLMTETIGLAPKAPYIMAEGQNESHETMWDTANTENWSVLFYKPVSVGGQLAPPPQRNQYEPPIAAMVEAAVHYEQDIKATTMVSDAKLGARSNETSGAAINARKAQSDVSNYNYIDNRDRAIRHMGRAIIDLIPTVYSTRNIMRIIGEDDEPSMVNISHDPSQAAYIEDKTSPDDIKKIYNLSVGQYDVAVTVGPTYLSKRQEGFEMLTKMVNSRPELMDVVGDIIFSFADIPGAKAISKRLYAALDPKFKPEEGQASIPPQVAQHFQAMQQTMEAMTKKMQEMDAIIQNKQVEAQAELAMKDKDIDARTKEAALKAQTEMAAIQQQWMAAQLKAQQEAQQAQLDAKFSLMEQMITGLLTSGHSAQEHQQTLIQQQQAADLAPTPTAPTA